MFQNISKIVNTIVKDAKKEMYKAIDDSLIDMEDMNREQLLDGKNADNEDIGEYRSPRYAEFKRAKNSRPRAGVPDLNLEGDHHKSIYAKRKGDVIDFDATDWKRDKLVGKYGKNIYGLTDKNKELQTYSYILPKWLKWLNSQIKQI
jgi:hypothetical protein